MYSGFNFGIFRPYTHVDRDQVFFSSSGQIARLIENMSRDVDAGSFNITPDRANGHVGHSASSSLDMHWTMEERLEHMLGAVSQNP